jgi:Fuc2NAc and GlcNAc transferase
MSIDVISLLIGCAVALVGAMLVTGFVLWLMRRWQRLVAPSERGAHSVPMPTAGGLGIIVGFLMGHAVMGFDLSIYWLGAVALILVAAADDLVRPLKVWEKTLLLVVATSIFLMGIIPDYDGWFGLVDVESGIWLWPLGICWFFWVCNVFNFMDGIDGISSTQALLVAGWMAIYLESFDVELAGRAWLLGAASGGFLFFNFPPARIFMGDVGSIFIGFVVAALVVLGMQVGVPIWYAIFLLGYYLFDTSYALVRRLLNGENLLLAHNKHLYQRLVRIGWSHGLVDLWAGTLTLLNGLGIFCIAHELYEIGIGILIASLLILLYTAFWVERKDACFA